MSKINLKGLDPEKTEELIHPGTILMGYRGSVAHGTYVKKYGPNQRDDKDLLGVAVGPLSSYFGLSKFEHHIKEIEGEDGVVWDAVTYELKKYIGLLLAANPNVLSLLFLPENLYVIKSELGKRLIDNRDIFCSKAAYNSFVGYAHGQLHRMTHPSGKHMGKKRRDLVLEYGFDCYDNDTTEFLTSSGWKHFDNVSDDDMIATVNSLGDIEMQLPTGRTDKPYSGHMYIVEPSSSKAIVTENHNMLVSPAHRGISNKFSVGYDPKTAHWQLIPLRSLLDGHRSHYHVMRCPNVRTKELPGLSDEYLWLAGAYISEGSAMFYNGKKGKTVKGIRISQKTPGEFFTIMGGLEQTFGLRRYDYSKETVWLLHGDVAKRIVNDFGYKKGKHLPNWCFNLSARQASILWESAMLGDGTENSHNSCYYSSLYRLASDIHAMCISAGIPCVMYGPYEGETSYGPTTMYHVVKSKSSDSIHCLRTKVLECGESLDPKKGYPVKEIDVVNRRVVCFEVPNGTLITRNNGRPAIHGNCKNASHLIRILRTGIEFLSTGEISVAREDAQELLEIKNGEWSLERVEKLADSLFEQAHIALIHSELPNKPDYDKANDLCVGILRDWFTGLDKQP